MTAWRNSLGQGLSAILHALCSAVNIEFTVCVYTTFLNKICNYITQLNKIVLLLVERRT